MCVHARQVFLGNMFMRCGIQRLRFVSQYTTANQPGYTIVCAHNAIMNVLIAAGESMYLGLLWVSTVSHSATETPPVESKRIVVGSQEGDSVIVPSVFMKEPGHSLDDIKYKKIFISRTLI